MQRQLPTTMQRVGSPVCVAIADGTVFPITGALRIGRDEGCEIAVNDRAASRTHALIEERGDGTIVITDQHSRNGTFVDGRPVSSIEVRDSAIVRIGESVFRITRLEEATTTSSTAPSVVGGPSLVALRRTIGLVAPTDLPVLVLGETGTGKEVVSHALHTASKRDGALVAVNCAALPGHLIESELFGHARNSFTGAGAARRGLFAEADGGTLFLDEVGELPLELQAKLLRVLETKSIRAVGSDREQAVDVRVISATNRNLHASAGSGQFRPDLLARLAGVELTLLPLRDRSEDLGLLIRHLWQRAHGVAPTVTADALEAMALYDWPLNVRELDHALRASSITDQRTLDIGALPGRISAVVHARRGETAPAAVVPAGRSETLYDLRETIERALREHRGNVQQVAKSVGVARGHLYRALRRWNLDPAAYRAPTVTPDPEVQP